MKYFVLFVFIFVNLNNYGYSQTAKTASAVIQLKTDTKVEIPQELFGGFTEFLLDYINGSMGIWAQEVFDRGFDITNYAPYDYKSEWRIRNENSGNMIYRVGGYNKNGLNFINYNGTNSDSRASIFQKIFIDDSVDYEFYIYAKTSLDSQNFYIRLLSLENEIIFEKQINIESSEWKKYTFQIPKIANHPQVYLTIDGWGAGNFDIDECSMIPNNNVLGVRREYLDLFKQMKLGMLRYPGGWFAESPFHKLEYCIGDIDQRQSPNLSNRGFQRMDFGLIEFLEFCEYLECEPQITTSFEHFTPQQTSNYWQYCKGSDTNNEFVKKRHQDGRIIPFEVNFWEIGNEVWGINKEYAEGYLLHYDALRALDDNLKIIINGNHWEGKQNIIDLFGIVNGKCDFYSYHPASRFHTSFFDFIDDAFLRFVGDTDIYNRTISDFQSLLSNQSNINSNIKQGTTEWWTDFSREELPRDWLIDTLPQHSSLMFALINAGKFQAFLRNSDVFKFASRTIGIGLIQRGVNTDGTRAIWGMSPYQALKMYAHNTGKYLANTTTIVDKYSVESRPSMGGVWNIPFLDIVSTYSQDSLYVAILNRNPYESYQVDFSIDVPVKNFARVSQIYSDSFLDITTSSSPEVLNRYFESVEISNNRLAIPKHSLSFFVFELDKENNISWGNNPNSVSTIEIFPNPVNDILQIYFNTDFQITSLIITDLLGRTYIEDDLNINTSQKTKFLKLDLSNLTKGTYIITVKTSCNSIFQHILIKE